MATLCHKEEQDLHPRSQGCVSCEGQGLYEASHWFFSVETNRQTVLPGGCNAPLWQVKRRRGFGIALAGYFGRPNFSSLA